MDIAFSGTRSFFSLGFYMEVPHKQKSINEMRVLGGNYPHILGKPKYAYSKYVKAIDLQFFNYLISLL